MKKIFTLLVSALCAGSALAQIPSNAVGLYRTQIEDGYFSVVKEAKFGGVTIEQTMGETTKSVDLDNDEVYGTSTEMPRYKGANIELEEGVGRIFPAEELSAKSETSFVGFKMTIPAGKTVNIDRLVARGFFGNAFYWCADVISGGEVVYTTDQLKVNNYNRAYAWADNINVTATEITGVSEEAKAQIATYRAADWWADGDMSDEEYVYSKQSCKAWGKLLTDAVKNLSGEVEVRLYYWGKAKKAMAIGELYVELSGIEVGENDAPSATATGLYRTQIEDGYFSVVKEATYGDVTIEQTMGETTKSVDLDNDEVYGTSTEMPRYKGANIELEEGVGRIFPAEELSAKSETSYVGFKMTIPAGKTVNIDRLVARGFFGNAFYWCADVISGGEVVYTTDQLKVNNYNRAYAWADNINVTATEITGVSEEAKAQIATYRAADWWADGDMSDEEYVYSKQSCKAWGKLLTDAVKNLSGEVEVRLYYWGKVKKAMAIGELYVELSDGTGTGISSISNNKAQDNAIYTLQGVRVSKPVKGINIINGKKVIVK